jgi:AraC-like DNA-binding protein
MVSVAGAGVRPLDAGLWGSGALLARSREFRPLYIHRYRGIRPDAEQTCHGFWEIICVRHGTGLLRSRAARHPLEAGTLCLIPPREPHMENSDSAIDLIWMGFQLGSDAGGPQRIEPVTSLELSDETERLWLLAEQGRDGSGAEIDGRARAIVARLRRLQVTGAEEKGGDVIERAIRHIHNHFPEVIAVPAMVRQLGCSEGYFHRLFRKRTGRTPMGYLTEVRMRHARRLLEETALPIKEIATLAGFEDPLYFSRVFRKEAGLSPAPYRERQKNGSAR